RPRDPSRERKTHQPGSREFSDAYEALKREHVPQLMQQARGAGRGALAWVIEQYRLKSEQWLNASESTRAIYDRRHHWLGQKYGYETTSGVCQGCLEILRVP